MAFEVTLVPKENIELGVTEKAVFTLSNVTPTIPVPGPKGDKGDKGDTGPQGPQGLPGTGVNTTDDIPEGDTNLYYTDERVEGVIAANVVLATGTNSGLISSSDFTKLQGIASGAEVNVNADWNAISGDAQILNKPTIISSVSANSPITSSGGTTPVISTSMTTNRLIGRGSAGTGAMEEISIGSGLQLSGTTLSATGGGAGSGITKATASGTDTYTASVTGFANYSDGDTFLIRFTNGNTTGATLNINSLGAKTLYNNNDGALIGGDITAGSEMLCIFNTTLNGFQVIGTSPNSLFAYVTNAESTTITKGQPVYAFGGTGDRLTVKLAYNTGDSTSAQTIGLVLSDSIGANQKGIIIVQGAISGLSLFPTSTWSDGDAVYLGATAGTLTKTKPSAPNHLVYLGFVTTASNGAAGRMYVRVQNGYELQELHNVALSNTPTNNDGLFYESATSLWKNKSIPTVLGYTPEPTITAGTTGQYYRGDKTFQTLDKTAVGLSNVDNTSDANKPISSATQTALNAKLNTSLKGANNGLAELDSSGKVPTSQLPSYVDDVLEYANIGSLPATGSAGIIYVTLDDNKIYRWSGTAYVVISDTIALGETSATAYRGDRGKTAYDHSQIITGNPHGTTKADIGLGNVDNTSDATKNSAAVSLTNKIIDCSLNTLSNIAQSSVTNLTTDLAGKVAANTAITGATKTKITYDTKGLVTAGADATTADIADSTNKRYVTDAQLTVIGNTSGTNTGDQNTFGTIAVAGQSNVVADATNDTLTLIAGTGVSITTNASTDAITINSSTNLSLDDITASGTINILNDNGTGVSIPLATSIGSGIISASNFDKLTALSTARQIPPLGSTGQVLGKVSGTDYAVGWIDNVVDGSVTFAKMANISTNTLIGRATAGTGVPESIGIGSFMSLSGGILFNTLAVGSGSNQTIIGGANASGTLTLSSTSNATKGKILFGASAYDEVNDRLGINQATPTARLQINNNQNSVTQSDANGILLANSTAATNGTQSVSPPIVWQGNSWATTPAASQDVRYRMFLWPNQGSTAGRGELTIQAFVSGTLQNSWAFSENGIFRGNHINGLLSLYSNNISAGVQMQSIGLNGFSLFQYRTTNGGADISPQIIGGVFGSTAGILTYGIDSTNGITFNAANGTRSITRASINIANLNNTAGSESGDLIFLTQSGGTAASEKFRISSGGNFTFFDGGNFILGTTTGTKIGTATSQKIGFWNATPIIQPTTGVAAATLVSNAGTALTSTDTFDGYTLQQIVKALRNIGILA